MLEFVKLIVQPVVQIREDGKIVGEQLGQQTALYSLEEVKEFLDGLEAQISKENEGGEA